MTALRDPVATKTIFYISISLVTVTLFARCFLKISTSLSSDLTDIKFIILTLLCIVFNLYAFNVKNNDAVLSIPGIQ